LLANVYLHRLDRAWQAREHGVLVRYADDVLVLCATREQAEAALGRLRDLLAELGLEPKAAKTRIVHLTEGGEGFDFLGFHHRLVRGRTPRSAHLTFLARWPSRKATQRARDRIREITDRKRLLVPVEDIVAELNRFLRGWAGYFRYGNSARVLGQIRNHALRRVTAARPATRAFNQIARPVPRSCALCRFRPGRLIQGLHEAGKVWFPDSVLDDPEQAGSGCAQVSPKLRRLWGARRVLGCGNRLVRLDRCRY
jgi:hypothetical protein